MRERKKTVHQIRLEAWSMVCEIADFDNQPHAFDAPEALLRSLIEQAKTIINQPRWGSALRLSRTHCQPCEEPAPKAPPYTERDAFMDGVPWEPLERMSDDEYATAAESEQRKRDAEEGFDE